MKFEDLKIGALFSTPDTGEDCWWEKRSTRTAIMYRNGRAWVGPFYFKQKEKVEEVQIKNESLHKDAIV